MNEQKNPTMRYPGKTVYILGAGFSVTAGIPLMKRFLPRAFELLKQYGKDEGLELARELAQLIDSNRAAAQTHNINLENIEELFSLVDDKTSERAMGAAKKKRKTLSRIKKNRKTLFQVIWAALRLGYCECGRDSVTVGSRFREQVEKWRAMKALTTPPRMANALRTEATVPRRHFFLCPQAGYRPGEIVGSRTQESGQSGSESTTGGRELVAGQFNCCVYEAFLSYALHNQMKRLDLCEAPVRSEHSFADAIITTNYDLVLEEKLRSFAQAKVYYGDGILSPHGLVPPGIAPTWPDHSAITAHPVLPIIKIHGSINWRWATNQASAVFWDPDENGADRICDLPEDDYPVAPPTWRKTLQNTELFTKLASNATNHLKTAQRIVVIGYSMPTTDTYLKYMMAQALNTAEKPQIEIWDVVERSNMEPAIASMFGAENAATLDTPTRVWRAL